MQNYLLRFQKNARFMSADTETSDLNLATTLPFQVSWVIGNKDKNLESHDHYVDWPNFENEISAGASAITRFNAWDYRRRCEPPEKVYDLFQKDLFDENTYSIWANVLNFDVFVVANWQRAMNKKIDYSWIKRCICIQSLEKAIVLGYKEIPQDLTERLCFWYRMSNFKQRGLKTNLAYLLKKYEIPHDPNNLHNSLEDVGGALGIFRKQLYLIDI